MNWDDWIYINQQKIKHVVGFEEDFVRKILSKIPEISPSDVEAQCHFIDSKGGNRYIDFMIVNKQKGYCLPIELDGQWKVTDYTAFNDMLERQNDLLSIYGVMLRYTNKKMLKHPSAIISEIRKTLDMQSNNQLSQSVLEQQNQRRVNEYQQELDQMKGLLLAQQTTNGQGASGVTNNELASIQSAIADLQASINRSHAPIAPIDNHDFNLYKEYGNSSPSMNQIALTVIVLLFLAFIVFVVVKDDFAPESVALPVSNSGYLPPDSAAPTQVITPSDSIRSSDTYKFIGEKKTICGTVAQVKDFSRGIYLNLGAAYPNQDASIVVWDDNINNFDNLHYYEGSEICVNGSITEYKNTPQIALSSPSQLL